MDDLEDRQMTEIPPPQWVDVDGRRTRHFAMGEGPPIVLLHGGGVDYRYPESSESWFATARFLAANYRVYMFDKLGCGHTESPEKDVDFSVEAILTHATRFMELRNINGATVVGHSRGVLPALGLALSRPDLVSRVVTLNSSTFAPTELKLPTDFYTRDLEDGLPSLAYLTRVFDRLFYGNSTARDNYFHTILDAIEHPNPQRLLTQEALVRMSSLEREYFRPSITRMKDEILAKLSAGKLVQPLLVLWGTNDASSPFEVATRFFETAAKHDKVVSFVAINRSGHYPHVEHPRLFANCLQAWLKS